MGGSYSQADYDRVALQFYENILQYPDYSTIFLPDVGIDESLLKYSGSDSNAVLQVYSNKQIQMPDYVEKLGSAIGPLTSVPNAVGLGALVISLIIEIAINGGPQTSDDTYSLIRRVFGEEKASSVRDTMSEYLKRHRMYMKNDRRLRGELRRLEQELSKHLTILRNSLLQDGQMSDRGLKIWVNGAAFHVQMLIHGARLDIQAGKPASVYLNEIKAAIDEYLLNLDPLLEKYKTYKINYDNNEPESCFWSMLNLGSCGKPEAMTAFMDVVFSKYEPIKGLKSYFSNIKNNLNSRIHDRGSFTVPSAAG